MMVQSDVVHHHTRPSLVYNGPIPLGTNTQRSHTIPKFDYPHGARRSQGRSSWVSKLAYFMYNAGMGLFPDYSVDQNSLWEILPEELKEKDAMLKDDKHPSWAGIETMLSLTHNRNTTKIHKAALKESIAKWYLEHGKKGGYRNQHVIFQKPAMIFDSAVGKKVYNPDHKYFILIPAECYYEEFTLPSDLFPGYEKSGVLANRDRIPQDVCEAMFGDYGWHKEAKPVQLYSSPNCTVLHRRRNVQGKMQYCGFPQAVPALFCCNL